MRILVGVLVAVLIVAAGVTAAAAYRAHTNAGAPGTPTSPAGTASVPTPSPTGASSPAPTETTTPAAPSPAPTGPATPIALIGTYWTCTSDQTGAGTIDHSEDGQIRAEGGVRSALCQKDVKLAAGAYAFRIPVGHFTPYQFCGITVANIIDPYQPQVPPSRWIAADYLQFDQSWTEGAPSGTC